MKNFCKYHPTRPAKWACQRCQLHYCAPCIPEGNEKTQTAFCPACKQALCYQDSAQHLRAFWQSPGHFFSEPFRASPALVIVLCTLMSFAFVGPFLAKVLAATSIIFMVVLYAHETAYQQKKGRAKALALNVLVTGPAYQRAVGSVSLIVGAVLLASVLYFQLGLVAAIIFGGLSVWLLPTLLMNQIIDADLRHTFQLNTWLKPIVTMGQDYAILSAYGLLGVVSVLVIADFALQHFPSLLVAPFITFACSYFMLCLYGLFAYVIEQYASFETKTKNNDVLDPRHSNMTFSPSLRVDADLDMAIKQGRYQNAITLLEQELKRHSSSERRLDQLYQLLLATKDNKKLERYSHSFLWLMLKREQIRQAADFIRVRQLHNPRFKLYDLELCLKLALQLDKLKDHELVLWLSNDAHIRFDTDVQIAELCLLAAKTLVRHYNQGRKARQYLAYIMQTFPGHPLAKSAKILDQQLEKIASTSN